MRTSYIFLFFCALIFSCDTQSSLKAPEENYFIKYFGNEGNQQGVDFVVNSDGSIVLIGNSKINATSDQQIYIAKADAKGKVIWEKTFGSQEEEEAKDIELLSDGTLLVLANVGAIGNRDVYLLKVSQDGDTLASKRQGLKKLNGQNGDENATKISVISKGIVVTGSTSVVAINPITGTSASTDKSDAMHLLFLNNLAWVDDQTAAWQSRPAFKNFGLVGEDVAVKVYEFDANTFYVMGYTNTDLLNSTGTGTSDFNFLIYGLTGNGGAFSTLNLLEEPGDQKLTDCSVVPPQSGSGYYLTGTSQTQSSADVYFVQLTQKLSFNKSDPVSKKPLNTSLGLTNFQSTHNSPSILPGLFVTSEKQNGNNTDIYLARLDSRGVPIYERTFGGIGNDYSGKVLELPNRSIVMIGTMTLGGIDGQTKIALIKLNSDGRLAP